MAIKRRIIWALVAAVLVAACVWGARAYLKSRPQPPKYDTISADHGSIVAKVTATGTLSALVTVQVGSQVSGRIIALYADFNSPAIKGHKLAKLDPQMFAANVAQAAANLTAAEGTLAKAEAQAVNAKLQLNRSAELAGRKLIAEADLDTARAASLAADADVKAGHGGVAQARANLDQARINLDYTDIRSPVNGVVISRNVDVGQTVAASLQAPVLFTIAEDMRKMQVDTNVAEADVGKLAPQMPAMFTVDAYPGVQFKGSVRQIRNAPVTVQNVVTYDAVIDVDNTEGKLKPGMTATVTFVYAERKDVLRVPNAALRYKPPPDAAPSGSVAGQHRRPDGSGGPPPDKKPVWVLRNGVPQRVMLKLGISDGSMTEVIDGQLAETDQLVTGTASGTPPAPNATPASGGTNRPGGGMGRVL